MQSGAGEKRTDAGDSKRRIKELYIKLMEIDQMRRGYYSDALAGSAAILVPAGE